MRARGRCMMDLAWPSNHRFFISTKILPHLPSSIRWIWRLDFGNLQLLDTVININNKASVYCCLAWEIVLVDKCLRLMAAQWVANRWFTSIRLLSVFVLFFRCFIPSSGSSMINLKIMFFCFAHDLCLKSKTFWFTLCPCHDNDMTNTRLYCALIIAVSDIY